MVVNRNFFIIKNINHNIEHNINPSVELLRIGIIDNTLHSVGAKIWHGMAINTWDRLWVKGRGGIVTNIAFRTVSPKIKSIIESQLKNYNAK